jgi:hypothetical protein
VTNGLRIQKPCLEMWTAVIATAASTHTRSNTTAIPWPTPMHMVHRA